MLELTIITPFLQCQPVIHCTCAAVIYISFSVTKHISKVVNTLILECGHVVGT